jgi:hypothetical protein
LGDRALWRLNAPPVKCGGKPPHSKAALRAAAPLSRHSPDH